MGEVQFAKQYLTTLDAKNTKYQSDHVFDPKTFETRIPYTLPRLAHPPHPLPPTAAPPSAPPGSTAATPQITIVLKSTRNPSMTLTLPSLDPTITTIQSLKDSVQSMLGGPSIVSSEKIKVLLNKKPIPASKKTVSEALDGSGSEKEKEIELGVMVMGGAPDPPPQPPAPEAAPLAAGPGSENAAVEAASVPIPPASEPMEGVENASSSSPVQPGEASGKAVLESAEFWDDLQGFLEQRTKDASQSQKVRDVFEKAWKNAG